MKFGTKQLRFAQALYGPSGLTLPTAKPKPTKKANTTPTEKQEQLMLMKLVAMHPLLNELLIHIPNEGKRESHQGRTLVNMGLKAGVSDLFLPVARGSYHGLWIELKRTQGGKVSELQQQWIDKMHRQGYAAKVAYGCDEAWNMLTKYLQGELV